MPNSIAISFNISGTETTNKLQSNGRSSSETSGTTTNECRSNKIRGSEIQSPVSSTTKSDSIAVDNGSQDGHSVVVSIGPVMKNLAHDGATARGDRAPSQLEAKTEREIGGGLFKLDSETSGQPKIAISKGSDGKSLELNTKSSNYSKMLGPSTTRRSSRISKVPARYENAKASVHTPEVEKQKKVFKIRFDKKAPESSTLASLSQKTLIDFQNNDDISSKIKPIKETAEPHSPRKGPGRPRKRLRDEKPPEEMEPNISEISHKRKKGFGNEALDVMAATTTSDLALTKVSKPKHKSYILRGRGSSRVAPNSTRKTRSQSSAKNFDSNFPDSLTQSPSTERSSPPDSISKLDFTKLDINSLHSFIGDAINHYSSLPKKIGDPDGFKALYRTFFPSSSYQHYAKALELEVSDLNLREVMRKIWEMVNDGENDKEVVLHKLGLSWAKKGASKKML